MPPVALHVTSGLESVLPSLIVGGHAELLLCPASRLAFAGHMFSSVTVGVEARAP